MAELKDIDRFEKEIAQSLPQIGSPKVFADRP